MVREKKEKDNLWATRLESREDFLVKKSNEGHWERFIKEYQGDYSDILTNTPRVLPINLIYAYVRSKTPDLYVQDPYFEFTPKKRTTIGSAKLKEIAVNDIWHRKKFKREVKKGIQDGLLIGHAWYKVGFNANLGNLEELDTTELNAEEDDYFFYRVNWRHMLFNAESTDPPYDSTWVAQKFFIPLEEAKKKFKGKANDITGVKLSGNEKKESLNKTLADTKFAGDVQFAELYEVWDKEERKVLIVSKQKNVGVIEERDWPYETMQNFPFLMLNLSIQNDEPYGISDVGMGENIVLEKIKMRTAFLEHLKRGNRQIVTRPDNLSQESKDAYQRGDDSALLEAEDPNAFSPLPYAPFQPDVFGLETRLDDDLSQVWGQRAPDRAGAARTQTRTKFELQSQSVGSTNRLLEQQNVVQDILEEAAEKLSSLLEEFATEPFYVQLTGFRPAEVAELLANRPSATRQDAINSQSGFTITNDDIKGPVDVRIKRGSAIPLDRTTKLQVLERLGQIYTSLKGQAGGPFLSALAKEYVEEIGMPELTEALRREGQFIAKQRQQQQEQQLQQQQMLAGQKAAEMQLKAQDVATKQQKVDNDFKIDTAEILKDIQLKLAELENRLEEERIDENVQNQ